MPKSALCPGFPDFGRHVTPQGVVSGVDTGTLAQLRRDLPAIGEVVAPIRHADKPNEKRDEGIVRFKRIIPPSPFFWPPSC